MKLVSFIEHLYLQHAEWQKNTAVLAPNQRPLTYDQLVQQIEYTVTMLNNRGILRNHRVAVVLSNGPAMATAFAAIAAGATCAPLNPGYRAAEYEFFLSDLKAKALVIEEDLPSPALEVANALSIPIFRLRQTDRAGQFTLHSDLTQYGISRPTYSRLEDIALVLHTSGTTSRPKIVPLTQQNIMASARNIRQTLQLTPQDRCLNVMPLFHIHGLMAAVLASFTSGASLVCTPGFLAPKFYQWLAEFEPTWYTAVPTMHQAILSRAPANQTIIKAANLRFIRSSSASLPPQVLNDLESTFNAPVIEAYGMTEAAHQMACNPLPPGSHKAGTVGPAAGPDVAIMDEIGNLLTPGEKGEIVIRGQNVTKGYENNPEANEKAFTKGWFRTGDQGVMDEAGYLTITGRLKEIINRGGEKISPREVDEVLLNHPDVIQSLAFAVAHPQLGEDIVAAVVLADDATASPLEIRQFTAEFLADFKVPRQIIIMDEIPKGPTGKLQRIGLAERLGITAVLPNLDQVKDWTPPTTPTEKLLVDIWADVLALKAANGKPAVGIHVDFLDLGGDSVTATQIISRIKHNLAVQLNFIELFETATIAEQAALVDKVLLLHHDQPASSQPLTPAYEEGEV